MRDHLPTGSASRRLRGAASERVAIAAIALAAMAAPSVLVAQNPQPQPAGQQGQPAARPGSGMGRSGVPAGARPIPRGVLGGVPMTAEDSLVKGIVDRLDFDSYKGIIAGLAEFGDREQGTERNARAIDWIESKLQGWGYKTERLKYDYHPRGGGAPEPREQVYATKVGTKVPGEMYILSGHMDGRGGGQAVNDDASGTAIVMEIARVLAQSGVRSDRSIRFALWNNEETGLDGSRAYVEQRAPLQGIEEPRGSGNFPEPKWLGVIQHDMMMWDHGNPVTYDQALDADVDVEFQLASEKAHESAQLALQLLNSNRMFATDYPAAMGNAMSNTDSAPFQDHVAAVSMRENRRLYETGRGANPHWHRSSDLLSTYTDADYRLAFNAAQTTLGAVSRLAGVQVAPR